MKTTVLLKFDLRDPDLSRIREVARASREGKIVAFPTETVYGIGGPMSVPHLAETLWELKNRGDRKPFSYHIAGWEMLDFLKVKRDPAFRFLTRQFWPGPLTLLTKNQLGEKIGIRFPKHRIVAALINATGEPFIATSANMSGAPSPRTAEDVMNQLGGKIDYLLDAGRTEMGEDSTIVDVSEGAPVIIRRGAQIAAIESVVEKVKLGKFPRKKILFVCTGNSCRSPMAEGWLRSELKRKGLADQIEVSSCGIGARGGSSATAEAQLIMKNVEVDISAHRSKPCSREDIADADIVFAMSIEHSMFITGLVPSAKEKIKVFNIEDPIGMDINVYEDVMKGIDKKVREYWNEIVA